MVLLKVQHVYVIERHVVAIAAKNHEHIPANDDSGVTISSHWSFTWGLA